MSTWSDIKAAWSSGWKALQSEALRAYEAAIRANPASFTDKVEAFLSELNQAREHLDVLKVNLSANPTTGAERQTAAKYLDLEARYHELAAGLYADAQPAESIGVAPLAVGLVVGGVVVGVAGIAWAVAAYQYAVNLREQTTLATKELEARVEASQQGRTLQPSTVPPQPDPAEQASKVGWLLVGGLALAAGAIAVPVFLKKRVG